MKWYIDRLPELAQAVPIYSRCGDDCAVCPRYAARTDEELHETALFWYRVGWRDHVPGNDEMRCTGCGCHPACAFDLLGCPQAESCGACTQACGRIDAMLSSTTAREQQCRAACDTPEEFDMLRRAFYRKAENLGRTDK